MRREPHPHTATKTSTNTRRPARPCPIDSKNDTSAMITNPSAQTVSMIACTRVRIAYANVASISTATVTAVTPRLTSSGPQLIRGRQQDR